MVVTTVPLSGSTSDPTSTSFSSVKISPPDALRGQDLATFFARITRTLPADTVVSCGDSTLPGEEIFLWLVVANTLT